MLGHCCILIVLLLINTANGLDDKTDYEVFKADDGTKSQSLQGIDNGYASERGSDSHVGKRDTKTYTFSPARISPVPEFTKAVNYISPDEVIHRIRRDPRNQKGHEESFNDGYAEFLANFYQPKESKNSQYRKADSSEVEEVKTGVDYNYDHYKPSNDYERIKALSDEQAKEIKKNPKHCKKVVKGDMVCHTCHNPKTGAKSESCSYSSEPNEKKYAYVREKSYNSDDEPNDEGKSDDEEETVEQVHEEKPKESPKKRLRANKKSSQLKAIRNPRANRPQKKSRQQNSDHKVAESRTSRDVIGLDPYLYGGDDDGSDDSPKSEKLHSYDDYFAHIFPEETSDQKSGKLKKPKDQYEYVRDYVSDKKNVDEVLAEFKTKDWSGCKKIFKYGLTCYLCKDDSGVKHEECMYVSDASPKKSSLAFKEVTEYHQPEDKKNEELVEDVDEYDGDDEQDAFHEESSDVVTQRAQLQNDKLPVNGNITKPIQSKVKKVLVSKRKLVNKLPKQPSPDDIDQPKEKRTIKRTVSVKVGGNLDQIPEKTIHYEHRISHIVD